MTSTKSVFSGADNMKEDKHTLVQETVIQKTMVQKSPVGKNNKTNVHRHTTAATAAEALPPILVTIYDEHKYIDVLVKVIREQLQIMKGNDSADYELMYDIMHYMREFPDRFHHPREEILFNLIAKKDVTLKPTIDRLIQHHEHFGERGEKILGALKQIIDKDSVTKREDLQELFADYIHSLEHHIATEEKDVLGKATRLLSDADWKMVAENTDLVEDPIFGHQVQHRYQRVYRHLAKRIGRAADDITLMEFVGLGALFESIAPISVGINEISSIVRSSAKKVCDANIDCYKTLWSGRTKNKLDYISKPISCFLDSYDCCVDGLTEIGKTMRKAQKSISEPYTNGFSLIKELDKRV